MDLKSVKQLADLMEERGLTHIEVCEGEHKIALSKHETYAGPAMQAAETPACAATDGGPDAQPDAPAGEELTAPLVGVVYLAPKPGEAPFVQLGDRVKKGQTMCILEAMKVLNEFTAPRDGEVAEICVKDEQLAEFGQCLFRLR